ncbi:MAG: 8-amino-7-oxononanoate synthase [Phycisphaeraceae bacterium]
MAHRRAAGLLRRLKETEAEPQSGRCVIRDGKRLLNLAGNDYLGLSQHPRLKQAACEAIARFGTGAGASRLVSGHSALHAQVEAQFAAFKHAQAALICPTGYMANLAAVTALAGPGDLVCIDKLSHASLIDAAFASGATVRVFPHLNVEKLERILSRGRESKHRFILTDSVFSMDGDVTDLPSLCSLAEEYGAMLIVDEAHGTGVLGENGAGLCEAQGVSERVDVVISTASKAMGGLGGIITSKQVIIDTIVNHARAFIYTTAVPAGQVAAIGAAIDVIREEPQRRRRLKEITRQVRGQLAAWNLLPSCEAASGGIITPIVPLITGSAESALSLENHLASRGILAPAIRPPTVAPGSSRVRISLRADMTEQEVSTLIEALRERPA